MSEDTLEDGVAVLRLLMIETHSPWDSGDAQDFLELTRAMLETGMEVQLHLIQNGVIWLLGKAAATLSSLGEQFAQTLRITSDDMSLDLRGMPHAVARRVGCVTGIDELVAAMAAPAVKTIWHS